MLKFRNLEQENKDIIAGLNNIKVMNSKSKTRNEFMKSKSTVRINRHKLVNNSKSISNNPGGMQNLKFTTIK